MFIFVYMLTGWYFSSHLQLYVCFPNRPNWSGKYYVV
jgi:hypothetical protein